AGLGPGAREGLGLDFSIQRKGRGIVAIQLPRFVGHKGPELPGYVAGRYGPRHAHGSKGNLEANSGNLPILRSAVALVDYRALDRKELGHDLANTDGHERIEAL